MSEVNELQEISVKITRLIDLLEKYMSDQEVEKTKIDRPKRGRPKR